MYKRQGVGGRTAGYYLPNALLREYIAYAVSYTHLDVYKRQEHILKKAPPARQFKAKSEGPAVKAVSYTHLDVYKRQGE